MITLVFFLLFVVLGIGIFLYLFLKELKQDPLSPESPLSEKPLSATLNMNLPSPSVAPTPVKEVVKDPEEDLVRKLDDKCLKLEEILREKNLQIAKLEEGLDQERSHRSEFEAIRDVLQKQIEDLKATNRKLKEDLQKAVEIGPQVLQEKNIDLAPLADMPGPDIKDLKPKLRDIFNVDQNKT